MTDTASRPGRAEAGAVPSRRGYTVAAAVAVVGLVIGVVWFNYATVRITRHVNGFDHLAHRGEVTVERAGTHTVWAEGGCAGYCRPEAAGTYQREMTLRFLPADGGPAVEPRPYTDSAYYHLGAGREGRAVWLVEFPEPGTYAVARETRNVISPKLFLGEGVGHPVALVGGLWVIGGIAAVLAGGATGVTFVRRKRALDRAAPARVGLHSRVPGAAAVAGHGRPAALRAGRTVDELVRAHLADVEAAGPADVDTAGLAEAGTAGPAPERARELHRQWVSPRLGGLRSAALDDARITALARDLREEGAEPGEVAAVVELLRQVRAWRDRPVASGSGRPPGT